LAISRYGRPRALSDLRDNTFFGIFGVRSEGKVDRWALMGEGKKMRGSRCTDPFLSLTIAVFDGKNAVSFSRFGYYATGSEERKIITCT
jgi:hypothetical protein